MSEAIFETDFNKMSHKQLCEKVEELYGIVAKLKRELKWQFENIDSSNLGKELTLKNGNMEANITATAEKLSSVYSKVDGVAEKTSKIEQTAEGIEMRVDAKYDFSKALNGGTLEAGDTVSTTNWDTNYLYYITANDTKWYFRYDSESEKWVQLNNDSVYSRFSQTSSGFKFEGNVSINGNLIVDNSIEAKKIKADELSVNKIKNQTETSHWFGVINDTSSLGVGMYSNLYDPVGGQGGTKATFENCWAGLKTDSATLNSHLILNGKEVVGWSNATEDQKFYPKNDWDFNYCNVSNLGLRFT